MSTAAPTDPAAPAALDHPAPGPPAPDPMLPALGRVLRRRRDAPGVVTLEIEPEDTHHERFEPGQFNMLTVFGVGEIPISLSGDPARHGRLVHTVRAVGPVSAALASLRPGAAVGLRGPFGAGWPLETAEDRDVLVVAGGLGLAPLRSALLGLLARRRRRARGAGGARGARSARGAPGATGPALTLLYGARSPSDALFRRDLGRWARRFAVEVTVDHADAAWPGHVGVVTRLIRPAVRDAGRTVAFVCGPEIMMRFAVAALGAAGIADESIYLSMERNMQCAVGHCGRCQLGPVLVCRDGPVFRYDRVRKPLAKKEI